MEQSTVKYGFYLTRYYCSKFGKEEKILVFNKNIINGPDNFKEGIKPFRKVLRFNQLFVGPQTIIHKRQTCPTVLQTIERQNWATIEPSGEMLHRSDGAIVFYKTNSASLNSIYKIVHVDYLINPLRSPEGILSYKCIRSYGLKSKAKLWFVISLVYGSQTRTTLSG